MTARSDAFAACAEFAGRLREQALALPGAAATVGDVRIAEPASNIVPGCVRASVDVRAPAAQELDALAEATRCLASEAAERHGCRVEVERTWRSEPVRLSAAIGDALRHQAEARGLRLTELVSGAGHDAGILAGAGVESGMLFVRSLNGGASHRPDELSDRADISAAVEVLAGTLRRLR